MKTINYYRATVDNELTSYGDTIGIEWDHFDTAMVYNITTGKYYSFGGEAGTVINDLANFPMTQSERENLGIFKTRGLV
tara:strand:+ start:484 stop:720 length:237 start_codon:yes stop_codon:yes gene_type:complete